MVSTVFVQPMPSQQFAPFSAKPPTNSPAGTESFQPSATSQKINTSVKNLQEVPSKRFV